MCCAAYPPQPPAKKPKQQPKAVSEHVVDGWLLSYTWARLVGLTEAGHCLISCTVCHKHNNGSTVFASDKGTWTKDASNFIRII